MNAISPVLISLTVRITSIRSANRKGCIAFGHRMDIERDLDSARRHHCGHRCSSRHTGLDE